MKGQKVIAVLVVMLIVLVGGIIGVGFYFYSQMYIVDITHMAERNDLIKNQVDSIAGKIKNVEKLVANADSELKDYSQKVMALDEKISAEDKDKEAVLSAVSEMGEGIKRMEDKYASTLTALQQNVDKLKVDMETLGKQITQNVDLGKIDVEKGDDTEIDE